MSMYVPSIPSGFANLHVNRLHAVEENRQNDILTWLLFEGLGSKDLKDWRQCGLTSLEALETAQ